MSIRRPGPLSVLAVLLAGLAAPAAAQLVLGQYEDEAPLRTWNAFPWTDAASLGRGGTAFTLASGPASALANPALLAWLPRLSFGLGLSLTGATLSRYGPVNTGVILSDGPIGVVTYAADFAGAAARFGPLAVGLSVSLAESYDRPVARAEYAPGGTVRYSLEFRQAGLLRSYQLAAALRLGRGLGLGLGLNVAAGTSERETVEEWTAPLVRIRDRKTADLSGAFVNAGLAWEAAPGLRLAAIVRSPHVRSLDETSAYRYQAAGLDDILIEGAGQGEARQPLVAGLGASLEAGRRLSLAVDVAYFGWSSYALTSFGEEQRRDFRDVVRACAGLEWRAPFRILGQESLPLRAGLIYDPQPVPGPASGYLGLTLGAGSAWKKLRLDSGLLVARSWGGDDALTVFRVVVSLGADL